MNNIFYFSGILLSILFMQACENQKANTEASTDASVKSIVLTSAQFETGKMALGDPQEHVFSEVVNARGYVQATPDGLAKVGVFVAGTVQNIRHNPGEWVNKGEVLFELSGSEVIQIQQDYAQNHARLLQAAMELERMKGLLDGNIVSQREFQTAQAEYTVLKANNEALALRLKMLQLKPDDVAAGNFKTAVPVLAPISAYISKQELVAGQYLEPKDTPLELVDTRKLQVNLSVFETDLAQLQTGQEVLFFSPGHQQVAHKATLSVVGRSINQESKTIVCTATIHQPHQAQLVHGMYVECEVLTCERTAMALPAEAIMKDGFNHYVLVKTSEDDNGMVFTHKAVDIGRETLEFTEVLSTGLKDVLVKGAYHLNVEE